MNIDSLKTTKRQENVPYFKNRFGKTVGRHLKTQES